MTCSSERRYILIRKLTRHHYHHIKYIHIYAVIDTLIDNTLTTDSRKKKESKNTIIIMICFEQIHQENYELMINLS